MRGKKQTGAGIPNECRPGSRYRKFACTLVSLVITTEQVRPVPMQPPLQPVQSEPGSGVAVNVTNAPCPNLVEQFPLFTPQLMPSGVLTMVPLPDREMESVNAGRNVALTVAEESSVTVQVGCAPAQAPLQPAKT